VIDEATVAFAPLQITAAIMRENGQTWSTSRSAKGRPSRMFYWASVGKAWVAVAILQLVEVRRISLTDKLARWAPDFPNADLITIDDLLNHTSGLFSFQEDPDLRARPGYKSREEVLAAAKARRPLFCPGQAWAYSNTGYVLLGKVIEAVERRPLHEVLQTRIIKRLGLRETVILAPAAPLVGIAPPEPASLAMQGTGDDIRTPGAAGPVAASASDMARFWSAALTGRLVTKRSMRSQYVRLSPMFVAAASQAGTFYGRGVMVYDVPSSPNTPADVWLGHSGGLPGAAAVVAWSVRKRAVVAVSLTGEGSAVAVANRLVAALD
jgi:D-alanyl-D-alanine carboxypeptidase